ncbi:MAG: hypothetical protein RLN75_05065 [Longimicrobiales bacterium]
MPPRPSSSTTAFRAGTALAVAWLVAGVVAGIRLHLEGGVFGEAVPLGASVGTRLIEGLPWVGAALAAWWAIGRWPLSRREILRPVTFHAWFGLGVVVSMQVVLAALRAAFVTPGLRPFDPWGALPAELTRRTPPALAVYAILVATAVIWRVPPDAPQDVPGAGRGDDDSP